MNYYHVLIKHSCKYLCPLNLFIILRVHNGETKWSFQGLCPRQSYFLGDLEPILTVSKEIPTVPQERMPFSWGKREVN